MTLRETPTPVIKLTKPAPPSIALSAPLTPVGTGAGNARMVREKAGVPSLPVLEGTLMMFINGLLADLDEKPESGELDTGSVTLVYFTPSRP